MKIVYYSASGNTEKMANLIAEGIANGGKNAEVINVSNANADIFDNEEIVILGCPAMGDEVFGSYGWGDGQWMRDWQERMESLGCTLIDDGLIIQYEPEDNSSECIELGMTIAKA